MNSFQKPQLDEELYNLPNDRSQISQASGNIQQKTNMEYIFNDLPPTPSMFANQEEKIIYEQQLQLISEESQRIINQSMKKMSNLSREQSKTRLQNAQIIDFSENNQKQSIAEQNLEKLQDLVTLLQDHEIGIEEIDSKIEDLMKFNETNLQIEKQEYYNENQSQTLYERNLILNKQIKEILQFNQQISSQNTELKIKIMEMDSNLENMNQQIQVMEAILQECDEFKQQYHKEQEEINHFLLSKQSRVVQQSDNRLIDRIMRSFDILEEDKNELQEQIEKLFIELEEQQSHYENTLNENHQLAQENQELKQDLETMSISVNELNIQLEEIKPQIQDYQQQIDQLEQQNQNLAGIVDIYNKTQEAMKNTTQKVEQEMREKDMEMYKISVEKEKFQRQSQQNEQALQIYHGQQQNLELLINQLQEEKSKIQKKNKSKREYLEQENFKLNKQNMELTMQNNQLEIEKSKSKEKVNSKSFEIENIKLTFSSQIEQLKKQLNDYETQIHKIKQYENDLEHKIIILENEKQDLEIVVKRQKKLLSSF